MNTPETDSEILDFQAHCDSVGLYEVVGAAFARRLEQQRDVLRRQATADANAINALREQLEAALL